MPRNCSGFRNSERKGTYYEDEAGSNQAPIFWQILGESDGSVLLLSEHIIDARPFHLTKTETDWENSTLREWLNNDFYQQAFSESEQQSLKAGTEQNDLVFLLSDEEVKQYLPEDSARTALPTPYAVKQGVYTNEVGESAWRLECSAVSAPANSAKNNAVRFICCYRVCFFPYGSTRTEACHASRAFKAKAAALSVISKMFQQKGGNIPENAV